MKFWPKVWGTGNSHQGEKQIAPLEGLGTPYVSSVDSASRTDIKGEFTEITLGADESAPVCYEFFTSEHFGSNANGSYGWEQLPGPLTAETAPAVAGSLTRFVRQDRNKAFPVLSNVFEPPAEGDWEYEANARVDLPIPEVATADGYNRQKAVEHIVWHDKAITFSTSGLARGLGSQLGRYSCHHFHRLENSWSGMSDIGNDIPPTRIDELRKRRNGKVVTALRRRAAEPVFDQDWVFSRHATSREVDGVLFFICGDNFGRLYVYKAPTAASPPGTYSAVATYWIATPPYPAWVTVPDPSDGWNLNRSWMWEFNSDGTRCVCCPFHTEEGPLLTIGHNYGMLTAAKLAQIDAGEYDASSVRADREDTPGLVEFGIEISNTGDGAGDFTVAFTLLREDYFGTSGRYIVNAAYSMPDKSSAGMLAGERMPADTLITAELELFAPAGYHQAGPSAPYDYPSADALLTDAVKFARVDFVLASNDEAMARTELQRLVVADNVRQAAMTPAAFGQWIDMSNLDRSRYGAASAYQTYYEKAGAPGEYVTSELGAVTGVDVFTPNTPVDGGIEAYKLGYITGLELRTCSVRYDLQDTFSGTYSQRLIHYNEVQESRDAAYFTKPVPAEYPSGATMGQVLSATHLLHWLGFTLSVSHWAGFSVHPKGHWAFGGGQYNYDAEQACNDVIQPYKGRRTTHREMFNRAFGQDREANFYTWTYDSHFQFDASLIEPKSLTDRGSFRVAGHWFDF